MSRRVLILGAGGSGEAALRLLAGEGWRGRVLSESPPPPESRAVWAALGFDWDDELPDEAPDLAVFSPGFAIDHPWLSQLRAQGLPLLPEFALGASRLRGMQIAITGSLGKTSTLEVAGRLLRETGARVTLSGNIGTPVCETARLQPEADFHLLELSSFQLEPASPYRPRRALCLNLHPNHLDRHPDLAAYARAKAQLFAFQTPEDVAIWPEPYPVPVVSAATRRFPGEDPLPPLTQTPFVRGPFRQNLRMLWELIRDLPGMAAVDPESALRNFQLPPHRMQRLEIPGAGQVVDDSKSTCLAATRAALESVADPVHLLMGGIDKGEDLAALRPLLAARRPGLYLFGASAEKMADAWRDSVDLCWTGDTLEICLKEVWPRRSGADCLLFSPGCASFDQFSGYAERGRCFQKMVQSLALQSPLCETN